MTPHEVLEETLRAELAPGLEIVRALGHGSMAHVYLAREPALKRLVALKVLRPELSTDEIACKRFEREAQSAAQISHPHVAGVLTVGRLEVGLPYLVMEYVDGRTLADALKAEGPLPVAEARRMLADLARALEAAHEKGIIHRDVRPANVIRENRTGRVVLTDFGIAAMLATGGGDATKLTITGQLVGDIRHMSPEHLRGETLTEQADIYSLGVLGYELLTGSGPYDVRSDVEVAAAHLKQPPKKLAVLRDDVDVDLSQLLERCLAKQPEHRPTAADVVQALTAEVGPEAEVAAGVEAGGLSGFLGELGRRRVYRVFIGYLIGAFALREGAQMFGEDLGLPQSFYLKAVPAALAGGFPIALVLAWMFDITGGGVQRTREDHELEGKSLIRQRVYVGVAFALSLLVSGYLIYRILWQTSG
jgi:tRNA A-37 threonylcarbamoyl transferase component Bud32